MVSKIESAISLAFHLHASQKRKASIVPGAPYMSHLLEVCGMVMANGGDDTVCAAAVLHDALEDVGGDARKQIFEVCGAEVLALVEECTEIGTGNGGEFKAPWKERKEAYLAHLAQVSLGALLISVADKLQSLRELYRQVRVQGDQAYAAFAKKEYPTIAERKNAVIWFHTELNRSFILRFLALEKSSQRNLAGIEALIADFDDIVRQISLVDYS